MKRRRHTPEQAIRKLARGEKLLDGTVIGVPGVPGGHGNAIGTAWF